MEKELTTITLGLDTANKLRMIKIKCKARNLDAVIKELIRFHRTGERK